MAANFRRADSFLPSGLRFVGQREEDMIWTICAILLILWLLGWGFHIAGALIHLLLLIVAAIAALSLLTGRRTA
jgi:hypothetical protein